MKTLQVFDRPMCCSTGVCGAQVDSILPRFAADLGWLRGQGVVVERFNLAHEPAAFATHTVVKETLRRDGMATLPLVLVDGVVVSRGGYPSREQLAAWVSVPLRTALAVEETCCGSTSCC